MLFWFGVTKRKIDVTTRKIGVTTRNIGVTTGKTVLDDNEKLTQEWEFLVVAFPQALFYTGETTWNMFMPHDSSESRRAKRFLAQSKTFRPT